MDALVFLIPLALCLGGLALAAFMWSMKTGQYNDLDGAAWRALQDDDEAVMPQMKTEDQKIQETADKK